MSDTFDRLRGLVRADSVRVSRHAFRRMGQQNIVSDDLLSSMESALVVEDYPDYFVGPSVLVLHFDGEQRPIHAVWGLEKGHSRACRAHNCVPAGPLALVRRFQEPNIVRTTPAKEYIHEAQYVAEVEVTLIEDDHAWAPYFSIEDVRKLETVRRALQARDLAAAAKLAKVYELKPVAAE